MTIVDDATFVGQLLDTYALGAWRRGVAAESPGDAGVPQAMQVGAADEDGWVEWRMSPSTLNEAEVTALETDFRIRFPAVFRAYLLSRFHLFDQVKSRRYDQQIFMPDTPSGKPLGRLRSLLVAWRPLIDAGFVPFAEWGDAWGPMCFDTTRPATDGDQPVVWMDHEALTALGADGCRRREAVLPLVQPLYDTCREFLLDIFGTAEAR